MHLSFAVYDLGTAPFFYKVQSSQELWGMLRSKIFNTHALTIVSRCLNRLLRTAKLTVLSMAYGFWYVVWWNSSVLLLNRFGLALPGRFTKPRTRIVTGVRRSETHFFTCIRLRGFPHDLHLRCVIANAIQLFLLLITETHLPQTKFAAKLFPYLFVNPTPHNVIGSRSGRLRLDHVGKARPLASGSAIGYCWLSHAPKAHISKVAWPARRATPEVNTLMQPVLDDLSHEYFLSPKLNTSTLTITVT